MGTRKLFHVDSHLSRFEGTVLAVRPGAWVALDATAFYPEEGGQRPDRGTLDALQVLEIEQDEVGLIWHRLSGDPGWETGRRVSGEIDAARRRDHRQQHSGQHVLSRAFDGIAGALTRSFHMGEEVSTIDLEGADLDPEALARVESRANEIVFEDRPVLVSVETRPGAEPLRTIDIESYDRQHCCGTHVRRTGEIGLIKVLRVERVKGMERVHFACGDRALAHFQRILAAADGAARLLSAGWLDLPRTVAGLLEQAKEADRRTRAWQERWASSEAETWARSIPREADGTLRIVRWVDDVEAPALRAAANALIAHAPAIAVLGGTGEAGKRPFLAARSPGLPAGREFDARVTLTSLLGPLGGRGGGSALFAQGACAATEETCRAAMAALRDA